MARDTVRRERRSAYIFGGRYFEPVNDNDRRAKYDRFFAPVGLNDRFIDSDLRSICARAAGIAVCALLLGGAVLTGTISLLAELFGSKEVAEHRNIGFLMGGVAGAGLSLWYLAVSIRLR